MTAIEEFQQKVKEGKLLDAFTLVASEATELKITTWVSSSPIEIQSFLAQDKPFCQSCLLDTRINLINGKINNKIGSDLIGKQDYAQLQKIHQEQVQNGREIILKKLENWQKLLMILRSRLTN